MKKYICLAFICIVLIELQIFIMNDSCKKLTDIVEYLVKEKQ